MKRIKDNDNATIVACYIGYITQAIVNNFVPLLFVTFQKQFGIALDKIGLLISVNFGVQLLVDLLAAGLVEKVGERKTMITAHLCSGTGLLLLAFLPWLFPVPYIGLLIGIVCYAIGGGLIEVMLSPIVEACPTKNKEAVMSSLHSFYCWGHVGVVLISTIFFSTFGIENWKILARIWAVIPVLNGIVFLTSPIYSLHEEGLKVSKTVGDLAGPMAFAILMGLARLLYGKYGEKIDLKRFMTYSSILCVISYLCIAFVPVPMLSLVGCAVCGFSVGIMWPGTFSIASASIRGGGTAMFALLALAGDLGCSGGPTLAGFVSSSVGNNLRMGILAAIVFPVLLLMGIQICKKSQEN